MAGTVFADVAGRHLLLRALSPRYVLDVLRLLRGLALWPASLEEHVLVL